MAEIDLLICFLCAPSAFLGDFIETLLCASPVLCVSVVKMAGYLNHKTQRTQRKHREELTREFFLGYLLVQNNQGRSAKLAHN